MENKEKLNILFTSDTHGWLLPLNYASNSKSTNGLTKLGSAIKEYSKENSILIDLGDTIQGSPLMYFHHLNIDKFVNPASKVMNQLKYDYFVPGNHDFNYGQPYLFDFINRISAKTLCANIYNQDGLLFKQGFEIFEKCGVKILIVGVTTQYIPNWENPKFIENIKFYDSFNETKKIVDKYRNEVDLVIVGYHGGLENDLYTGDEFVRDTGENQGYRMFTEIEGIDILLTGHQHRQINEVINGRVVMQSGFNGSMLGVVEIEFDNEGKINIDSINTKLLKAKDYLEDTTCCKDIFDIEEANQRFLDEVIGVVPKNNLLIKDPIKARIEKHLIVDFINNIQFKASNAMLSATSLANIVTGFRKEITVRNVLSTYIYANTLVVLEITGKILKEYLEKCAEYFVLEDGIIKANPRFSYPKLEHYNYDMVDGIDYVIDINKDFGERITTIKYVNQEVKLTDTFTIVLNNYRASGGGDFYMLKDLPIRREIPLNVAELMLDYIRENRIIDVVGNKNITLKT